MGFTIVFAAAIPAYIAGGVALLMGVGWLVALAVLCGTGVALSLLLALGVLAHDALRRPKEQGEGLAQPTR